MENMESLPRSLDVLPLGLLHGFDGILPKEVHDGGELGIIQANAKVRCGWSATMDQACHRHFAHRDAHGGRQNLHAFLLLQWGLLVGWKEIVLLLRCFIRMHGLVSLLNDLVQLCAG